MVLLLRCCCSLCAAVTSDHGRLPSHTNSHWLLRTRIYLRAEKYRTFEAEAILFSHPKISLCPANKKHRNPIFGSILAERRCRRASKGRHKPFNSEHIIKKKKKYVKRADGVVDRGETKPWTAEHKILCILSVLSIIFGWVADAQQHTHRNANHQRVKKQIGTNFQHQCYTKKKVDKNNIKKLYDI